MSKRSLCDLLPFISNLFTKIMCFYNNGQACAVVVVCIMLNFHSVTKKIILKIYLHVISRFLFQVVGPPGDPGAPGSPVINIPDRVISFCVKLQNIIDSNYCRRQQTETPHALMVFPHSGHCFLVTIQSFRKVTVFLLECLQGSEGPPGPRGEIGEKGEPVNVK